MNTYDLLNGLQPWDKEYYSSMGFNERYIDSVNKENSKYRDYVLTKLNLQSTNTVNLHGGSMKITFDDVNKNILPMDKITELIEAYGEDYIINQLGGNRFFNWIKNLFRGRSFEAFRARYDKLRDDIDTKIVQFEVESKGIKSNTTEYATKMRNLLLNNKFKTMMEIMLQNDPNMAPNRKDYIKNEISTAEVKSEQLLASITEFQNIVKEQETATGGIFFGLIRKGKNMFERLSDDLKKSFKEFNEIYKHFTELTGQAIKIRTLKAKYGSLTPEVKKKLAPSQLAEYEDWEKNKDKYEKIEAFTEKHLDEAHKLIQKQSELNMLINDYNAAFGGVKKQEIAAKAVLNDWNDKMRTTYYKIGNCISIGGNYAKILNDAKQMIIDNSNDISALSISAVKPVLEEYKKHIQSVEHTAEIMNKLVATLGDIRNNFIKVVPSQNLQADVLYVSAARTYLLSLVENIKRRQIMFSGGEKHIRGVIRAQIGGVYLPTSIPGCPRHFLSDHTSKFILADDTTVQYTPKTALALVTTGAGKVQEEPFGIVAYDRTTAAATDIAKSFDKWIGTITPKTTMILPILDLEDIPIIKIYKITYVDISDINALDIKVELDGEQTITGSNMKHFFNYKMDGIDYMIYNLYTNDADKIKTKTGTLHFYDSLYINDKSKQVILPVFGNIHQSTELIKADEYHLLNPLSGLPIMAFAVTDSTNKTITLNLRTIDSGVTMDADNKTKTPTPKFYHFNAIGITSEYAYEDAGPVMTLDGTNITPKKAVISTLTNAIDYHWNIIYQLSRIVSLIIRNCLHSKTVIDASGITFNSSSISNINNVSPFGMRNGIPIHDYTKLKVNTGNMKDIITNFFGGDPRVSVIFIRKIFNRELKNSDGGLVFYPKSPKSSPIGVDDSSLLSVDAPDKDSLTPKQRQAIDYIMRLIPRTSKYWSNQSKILDKINEFFKPEYRDTFEQELHNIQHLIYDLRKIEQDILKINVNVKQPYDLPKYSIITEELEVKPNDLKLGETGEAVTDAGKALRGLVEQRSAFLKEFAAELNVDASNIIALLREPLMLIYGGADIKLADWFYDPAHPDRLKILELLRNESGADAFVQQIEAGEFGRSIEKICARFLDGNLINSYNHKGSYQILLAKKGRAKIDGHHDKKHDKKNKKKGQREIIIKEGQPHHGKKGHKKKGHRPGS